MTVEQAILLAARGVGRLVTTERWVEIVFRATGVKVRVYR